VGGGEIRKGGQRVNMVKIFFTHICKWKMIPVETIPGIGRRKRIDGVNSTMIYIFLMFVKYNFILGVTIISNYGIL
jgi:hypothetical protein